MRLECVCCSLREQAGDRRRELVFLTCEHGSGDDVDEVFSVWVGMEQLGDTLHNDVDTDNEDDDDDDDTVTFGSDIGEVYTGDCTLTEGGVRMSNGDSEMVASSLLFCSDLH